MLNDQTINNINKDFTSKLTILKKEIEYEL